MTTDVEIRWPVEMDNGPRAPEEEIHRRAYEHYEARGRKNGHDLDDWVSAEAEISREIRVAAE